MRRFEFFDKSTHLELARSLTHLNLHHQRHVLLVILHGLLEQGLHLLGELARVLVAQSADVFT